MSMRISPGETEINEIITEYNARPDYLTAILKHKFGVKGHLGYLHIAQIDPQGKHILVLYHPPPSGDEVEFKIPLDPPVKTLFEIRPRMHEWRYAAFQHFQVPAKPVINYYTPPALFPFGLPITILLTFFFFVLFGIDRYSQSIREYVRATGGPYLLPIIAGFAAFMHLVLEPGWMYLQLRNHKTPVSERWKWLLTVVWLGFAGLNEWNECIEYERLRNLYAKTDVGKLPPRVAPAVTQAKKDL